MKLPILTLLALSGMAGISEPTLAVTPAKEGTPFQIVGHIQKFKLDSTLCPGVDPALQGARITVNGIEIIIPCNTIVTMPATYLTPKDIFDFNPNKVPNESGLALDDNQPSPAGTKPPFAAFEVALDGNIVNVGGVARHVAGIVRISQQSLNNGAGYINTIDADGTLHIGGLTPSPTTDARVRINDSGGEKIIGGRFGLQTSFLGQGPVPPDVPGVRKITEDGRFTADTGNPTIHAKTGYPMCVPRGPRDDRCPVLNRPGPANNPLSFFVMGPKEIDPPAPGMPKIPSCPECKPQEQAPLMVGDYINYAGTLAKDSAGRYYISAHTIDAWVGIYTEPGAAVAYINQEVSLVGTGTRTTDIVLNPVNGAPIAQEVAPRTIKVEGFTTDPTRPVEVYTLEVNPATGDKNPTRIGTVQPEAVPFGRFRFLITRAGVGRKQTSPDSPPVFTVSKPVREIRVKVLNVVPTLVANGLTSGQFDAPVNEYIFAENTFFGDPLIPFNFHRFCFLAQGSGPLSTAGRTAGPLVGQLVPWPGQIGTSFDPAVTPNTCQ